MSSLSPPSPEIIDRLDRLEHMLADLKGDPNVSHLERWLSKRECAAVLGVSAKWLQERVGEGCPHRTLAGGHKFRLSVVEPWLRRRGHLREVA